MAGPDKDTTRPYKPLIIFIDLQKLYAAPPTAEERALLEKHGAYIPSDEEIKRVQDIIQNCNALAEAMRGKVDIAWAAMAPSASFMLTRDLDKFTAMLQTGGRSQFEFHDAAPKQGDLFVAKTDSDAFSNPDFTAYLRDHGYTHVYIAGFQATKCALATALKHSVWEMFAADAAHIQTKMMSDLIADTYVGLSHFEPMPPQATVMAKIKKFGVPLMTSGEATSEIHANLGRPVTLPHAKTDPTDTLDT